MITQKIKKERGALLTIILVFESLVLLKSLFDINNFINPAYPNFIYIYVPMWYSKVAIISLVLALIINICLWTWKKFGVYLLIFSQALLLINNVFILKLTSLGIFLTLIIVVSLNALEFWAIYRKWKYFD